MRILLIADGRSPTARRWIQAVAELGHEITLVTTFPCAPVPGVVADICLPVAFSGLAGSAAGAGSTQARRNGVGRQVIAASRGMFLSARYALGPLTLRYYGPRLRWLVERIQPDLVHALRIPFEGMLADYVPRSYPLAVSIWGNDLTLHAQASARMGALTRQVLARADALMADTQRDIRLARAWGFGAEKPTLVIPGSGGVQLAELDAARALPMSADLSSRLGVTYELPQPLIVNPRGFRTGSVRQDTFFAAIPFVLERRPNVLFACAAMAGQREAEQAVATYHLQGKVTLLPHLPQAELWQILARAAATISVSQHDGTPNTLLEAMALGVLPIAGDIESLREWITPGVNGLLVEPDKPQALAEAILLALDYPSLREQAAQINREIVTQRATRQAVHEQLWLFYEALGAGKEIPV